MEQGMKTKIMDVLYLGAQVGYTAMEKEIKFDTAETDFVWSLIDFGYSHEFNRIEGNCSLNASMNFSMENWEKRVDSDIVYLIDIINGNKFVSLLTDMAKSIYDKYSK